MRASTTIPTTAAALLAPLLAVAAAWFAAEPCDASAVYLFASASSFQGSFTRNGTSANCTAAWASRTWSVSSPAAKPICSHTFALVYGFSTDPTGFTPATAEDPATGATFSSTLPVYGVSYSMSTKTSLATSWANLWAVTGGSAGSYVTTWSASLDAASVFSSTGQAFWTGVSWSASSGKYTTTDACIAETCSSWTSTGASDGCVGRSSAASCAIGTDGLLPCVTISNPQCSTPLPLLCACVGTAPTPTSSPLSSSPTTSSPTSSSPTTSSPTSSSPTTSSPTSSSPTTSSPTSSSPTTSSPTSKSPTTSSPTSSSPTSRSPTTPTLSPSHAPSKRGATYSPSKSPSNAPTAFPTLVPTAQPSPSPTHTPTAAPPPTSTSPTLQPSALPTTRRPTSSPSASSFGLANTTPSASPTAAAGASSLNIIPIIAGSVGGILAAMGVGFFLVYRNRKTRELNFAPSARSKFTGFNSSLRKTNTGAHHTASSQFTVETAVPAGVGAAAASTGGVAAAGAFDPSLFAMYRATNNPVAAEHLAPHPVSPPPGLDAPAPAPLPPPPPQQRFDPNSVVLNGRVVTVMFAFEPRAADELRAEPGELLMVFDEADGWLLARNVRGEVGLIPGNFVE